jgi:hypothetical protein
MFKQRIKKEHLYDAILRGLKYYYQYSLDQYLTHYNDQVRQVPNILNIELAPLHSKLNGRHPD